MLSNLSSVISRLPNRPGVYLFRGEGGQILYIGKAGSIKKRVSQYFRDSTFLSTRIAKMVSQINKIDYIETGSEIEALILESELIKKQQPKYNVAQKDDKNYLYIKIEKSDFPSVSLVRKPKADGGQYFGPYTDATAVRKTLNFLRRIFPYRSCKNLPKKPCLYYHLKRCPGPCVGKIDKKDYQKIIKQMAMFLEGNQKKIIQILKKEMLGASKNKEYEKAAVLRDRIFVLEHIYQVAILKQETERGTRDGLVELVQFAQKYFPVLRLHPAFRIEAYDISHLSGTLTTGSMIVFTDGKKDSSQYRMFKVKSRTEADDIVSMKEILSRRLGHREWVLPDLILLDGGKGQLRAGFLAQKKAGISIPYLALAKEEEQIYIPKLFRPIALKNDAPALLLLRAIRDEAHRFAREYHLTLRSKNLIKKAVG